MTADRLESAPVPAKYILAVLAVVFLTMAAARTARHSGDVGGQARTWLVIGVTFASVSVWLFLME